MIQNFHTSRFCRDEQGNVAIMFGLSLFALVGAIGGAVDVSRSIVTRAALQEVADYAALNLAATKANDQRDGTSLSASALTDAQADALAAAQKRATELGASNVTLTAQWLNGSDLKVTATSVYNTVFLSAVPGSPSSYAISVVAIAQAFDNSQKAGEITRKSLDYAAGDYNRVYMYCYNKDKKNDASANYGRSNMTPVSDNGGTSYPDISNFKCTDGTVSFRLYNVRMARTDPSKWESGNPSDPGSTKCGTSATQSKPCYNWYTDTSVDGNTNTDTYNTSPYQLETFLCDDKDCNTLTSEDNVPGGTPINAPGAKPPSKTEQHNRIPHKAAGCKQNKFMYFGWEDRPPMNTGGNGSGAPLAAGVKDPGGDRDYDDIRVIIRCPDPLGTREVKLIR